MTSVKISQLPDATTPLSGTEYVPLVQSGVTKKTTMDSLPYAAPGTGAVPRSIQDRLADSISAKDFGVVGDGVTDDTVAMQAALDYATSTGKTLWVPSGKYRMTSQLNFSGAVAITGDAPNITNTLPVSLVNPPTTGTWFYFDHTGIGFFCRDTGAVGLPKRFVNISDIGTYRPNQPLPAPGWAPVVCDEDIRCEYDVQLYNVVLLNPYTGILVRAGGTLNAQHLMGQPLYTGIYCERSTDVQYWNEVQWWPFWTVDSNVYTYTITNAVGFRVQRADGLYIMNSFSIWYNRFLLAQDASGALSGLAGFAITNCYADGCGGGIEIISDYYTAYGTINTFIANSHPSVFVPGSGIRIAGSVASQIGITGFSVTRANDAGLLVEGAAHTVNVSALKMLTWDRNATGIGAFTSTGAATVNIEQIPEFSGTPTVKYQDLSTGLMFFPVRYSVTTGALAPTGVYSKRFSINNDAVGTIAAPTIDKTVIMTIVPLIPPAADGPAGDVWLRCTASPASAIVAITPSPAANFTVTTGVLTGTTGTAGHLTVSAANDGLIYIENRTGAPKAYNILLTGN